MKKSDYSKLDWGKDRKNVDYETIYENRFKVLKLLLKNLKKVICGILRLLAEKRKMDFKLCVVYERKE